MMGIERGTAGLTDMTEDHDSHGIPQRCGAVGAEFCVYYDQVASDCVRCRQKDREPIRIYIASKSKHGARWLVLRDTHGLPLVSTWVDEYEDGATSDWPDLWDRCLEEASNATAFIMYVEAGETQKGSMVELGAALLAGVPVYWVGPTVGSVWQARGVTLCDTVTDALVAIGWLSPNDSEASEVTA